MLKTIVDSLLVIVGALLLAAWLSAPDAQADEPQTVTQSLRDEFACPSMHAEWLDDKTVQCLKEKPLRPLSTCSESRRKRRHLR